MSEPLRLRELRVAKFVASRIGDPERGPLVWINPEDASRRLLTNGELAWVHGPRRHELAEVRLDEEMTPGDVGLRDVAGVAPSEMVRIVKPELDTHNRRTAFA